MDADANNSPSPEARCGFCGTNHKFDNPDPEARVDWEKEAMELLRLVKIANHTDCRKPSEDCLKEHYVILLPVEDNEAIEKLLAAYEKGREKR